MSGWANCVGLKGRCNAYCMLSLNHDTTVLNSYLFKSEFRCMYNENKVELNSSLTFNTLFTTTDFIW